jgi:hypothetical protein
VLAALLFKVHIQKELISDFKVFFVKEHACHVFAHAGEASSSRYPQRNRMPPTWQRDYTFFGAC